MQKKLSHRQELFQQMMKFDGKNISASLNNQDRPKNSTDLRNAFNAVKKSLLNS